MAELEREFAEAAIEEPAEQARRAESVGWRRKQR
jgi:hypothetical protein